MEKLTIISHFYNEEYLLPHWIKNHINTFDHGVLFNWHSTDKSVEIIHDLAPKWEVIDTKNQYFTRDNADAELIDCETKHPGWKTTLQTSEFIFHPDLRGYLNDLSKSIDGVWMPPISLIDNEPESPLNSETPFVLQRTAGIIGKNNCRPTNRLIHRLAHGLYKGAGRHDSYIQNAYIAADLFHVWAGWSPWTKEFRNRKLQQLNNCDANYRQGKAKEELGYHDTTEEKLTKKFYENKNKYSDDLFKDEVYSYLYNEIVKSYFVKDYVFEFKADNNQKEMTIAKVSSLLKQAKLDHFIVSKNQTNNNMNVKIGFSSPCVAMSHSHLVAFLHGIVESVSKFSKTIANPLNMQFIIKNTQSGEVSFDSETSIPKI